MKPKFYIPTLILAVIIACFYFYMSIGTKIGQNANNIKISHANSSADAIFYPIDKIKQNNLAAGTYNTVGFVARIYTCPPCPKSAMCKPCMRNNIVISMDNQILKSYSLTGRELLIFVTNPKEFELGKKYRFTIKILEDKSTEEPTNDIELVGYNLAE